MYQSKDFYKSNKIYPFSVQNQEVHVVIYLDDIVVLTKTVRQACWAVKFLLRLLKKLGLNVSLKKSQLKPQRVFSFIDIVWDSIHMSMSLDQDKFVKVRGSKLLQGKVHYEVHGSGQFCGPWKRHVEGSDWCRSAWHNSTRVLKTCSRKSL